MKAYSGENIRNVALVGHGHAGKTSLASAMLFTSGATPRLGRVDDGSATTDYDDEEIARKMSVSTGLAVVEWGNTKINILDTPGFNMFVHEAKMALPVVDAAVVVVDGVAGVEVVTQRVWNYCEEYQTPRLIVVNRMDRDRADASRVLESIEKNFGRNVIPIELPLTTQFRLFVRNRETLLRPQGYFPRSASYSSDSGDPVLRLLFAPTFRWFDHIVSRLDVIQHGHIHLYVLYVAATLVALLVWASL